MKTTRLRHLLWGLLIAMSLEQIARAQGAMQQPQQSPLTLQQALDIARSRNPNLLASRQHLEATRANEVTAGLRQNPSFTVSGADVTLPANNPSNPYSYSANVGRLFERGEKRKWRLEVAHATTDTTTSQLSDLTRQTVLAVKQAFTQMLAAKAALQVANDNLESYRKTVDLSKSRLDAGDISATDFDRIDLQLAEFESDQSSAQLNLVQTSDQLQVLLGIQHPSESFDIAGTLDPPAVAASLDQVEQQALASRPDYLAAQQAVRLADASVKLSDADGTTDPTLAGEYERSGTYNSAGFSISIPVRIFDRNQGEKERTRFEAQSSRFAETAARNQVVSDVDQAWAALQTAQVQARRYNNHFVQEAARVRDNLEFSYRHGGATLLDYLDALRDYRQTNLNALNANAQVWLSIHQLSFAASTEIVP